MLGTVQSLNIEEIPEPFCSEVWPRLSHNGGNVIYAEADTPFGEWLTAQGFVFDMPRLEGAAKTWAWLVVFR